MLEPSAIHTVGGPRHSGEWWESCYSQWGYWQMAKKAAASRKKLTLWVSPQKHAEIRQAAEADRRSMTAWILLHVDKALEAGKRKNERAVNSR